MKLIVVSTNAGLAMGGEAVKALQYVQELLAQGRDVTLITHERCRAALAGLLPQERLRLVPDTALMRLCWRTPGLRRCVNGLFHRQVARLLRDYAPEEVVIQYLCPISPVELRFPPRGYRWVIGPVSGNIFYPPGFRHLENRATVLRQWIYRPLQWALGRLSRQYPQAQRVLVSGYARTEAALRWAGCAPEKMVSVPDAGLPAEMLARPRMSPAAAPADFVWIGRMVRYKGADLALRALAAMTVPARLTLYGDGPEMAPLQALVRDLGLADRVRFAGWLPHAEVAEALRQHRALVFPSLREANGIIMQEAMAIGLPVLALAWGGPMGLATPEEALFVPAETPAQVVRDLARSMDRLAAEPGFAETLSIAARRRAEADYPWPQVARLWYETAMPEGVRWEKTAPGVDSRSNSA